MVAGASRRIVIVGAGGHAMSVAETAAADGYDIVAFIGEPRACDTRLGVPVSSDIPDDHIDRGGAFVLAIGDNFSRQAALERLGVPVTVDVFPPLVHPSASISRFAELGAGTVVLQGAVIGAASRVGRFCIVNTRAGIDHDCTIEDYASIAPGATLGGNVTIGTRSAISIAAVVKHGITIGPDTVLGASSYAHRDLPGNCVAMGTPAKPVRTRRPDESYLS